MFARPKYPRMGQCKLHGRTMIPIPDVRAGTMGNLIRRRGGKAINGNICHFTYQLLDNIYSAVTGSVYDTNQRQCCEAHDK